MIRPNKCDDYLMDLTYIPSLILADKVYKSQSSTFQQFFPQSLSRFGGFSAGTLDSPYFFSLRLHLMFYLSKLRTHFFLAVQPKKTFYPSG